MKRVFVIVGKAKDVFLIIKALAKVEMEINPHLLGICLDNTLNLLREDDGDDLRKV